MTQAQLNDLSIKLSIHMDSIRDLLGVTPIAIVIKLPNGHIAEITNPLMCQKCIADTLVRIGQDLHQMHPTHRNTNNHILN